jgi:hypothetical protein
MMVLVLPTLIFQYKRRKKRKREPRKVSIITKHHVGKEDGETNITDLLTKVLSGQKRWDICWHFVVKGLKPRYNFSD